MVKEIQYLIGLFSVNHLINMQLNP
jgi:hypothetical protein